ncbi:MAG: hypothetical protein C0602_05155 [Denitrovibrio sp.]|nr:MAG: hypothetical protein C0602_05155 [Denitrovibrio sp.]
MIEGLALALMKTLATYLFKTYVLYTAKVNIEGAPNWYMSNVQSQVCVYEHQYGGLEAIDKAKADTYPKMQKELSGIIEAVIYENYSKLKDPKEKKFVMAFKNDPDAPVFIRKNMQFTGIEYKKKQQVAFIQACIDKDIILKYQQARADVIKYELTHKRADSAFEELEEGDMSLE